MAGKREIHKTMSVIIKNMDMPGSCFTCRFLKDIHRAEDAEGIKVIYVGCHVDGGEMQLLNRRGKRDDCPLEEVSW